MSWLSPRRRRTTGNLKTIPNGQVNNGDTHNGDANNDDGAPRTPTGSPRVRTPASERPPSTPRPFSSSMLEGGASPTAEGNLFYAYARRGDDVRSRYLLTFASASVANEWWLLVQAHFPDSSRPGPQLFSFRDPELLSKAWKHERFGHLKSKWMYISFGDTSSNGIGGAAQGIIPVQDAQGNMLGGGAPASPELLGKMGEVRREAKGMRNEINKLEEYFEKMMEAVERNTEQVAALASHRGEAGAEGSEETKVANGESNRRSFDSMTEISSHLSTVNELLKKNNDHVQALAKRQADNDQKLRTTLQDMNSRQRNDYLDMSQLSNHLDRIQALMESNMQDRKDSLKASADAQPAQAIDLSPLTDRLEKVQEAVEQNSSLVKALLEGGTAPDSKLGRSLSDSESAAPQAIDLAPLTSHLEKIHAAIEQQGTHMQALVGFASVAGDGAPGAGSGEAAERSLAPLGQHLEHIQNAIEEGNNHARDVAARPQQTPKVDIEPLTSKFDELLHAHEGLKGAVEAGGTPIDIAPLGEKLDSVVDHLENLREWTEYQSEHVKEILDFQQSEQAREITLAKDTIDFSPVTQRLDKLVEAPAKYTGPAVDVTPLTKHLEAIHTATQRNADAINALTEAQEKAPPSADINFTPLTDRLNRIHSSLEKAHAQFRDREESPGLGDAKFLMSALTSHLSKIQAVTEQNAVAVKSLREKHSATQDKMHIAVSETADQLRTLLQRNFTQELSESEYKNNNDARVDAMQSQVRQLMSGQREMVDVMRQLAKSITAQNKGACDHVVIPPPRKVGRKVVGFVYDAKDGPA